MADTKNIEVVISTPTINTTMTTTTIAPTMTVGARGKSAYESWLDQGYSGTEADFVKWMGTDVTFIYEQDSPSETWTIVHNLNQYPSVTIVDSGGSVVYGEVLYISNNELQVSFIAGFAGKAYLN